MFTAPFSRSPFSRAVITEIESGEAVITVTSGIAVSGRKIALGDTVATATSKVDIDGKKIAKGEVHMTATTEIVVTGVAIETAQGESHITALSSFEVEAEKRARSPPVEETTISQLSVSGRKIAKAQVDIDSESDLSIDGKKIASIITEMSAISVLVIQSQRFVPAPYLEVQQDDSIHRLTWGVD